MRTLAAESERYRAQADKLLSQTGLLAILKKYGEVSVLGINKKDGNIDVQVICTSCDSRKMQQIFGDISYHAKFDSFYSVSKDNAILRKKFSNIQHIGMSKSIEEINYSVDVWFVAPEEVKKHGGNIDVSRSMLHKFSRSGTSTSITAALGASKIAAYVLIAAFVFTATVGVLNFVFNGVLGLGMLSIQQETVKNINEANGGQGEGTYEGAFEEQLTDFPDIPVELPEQTTGEAEVSKEVEPIDAPVFIDASPELPENCDFINNMRIGDINDDVIRLQMFLNFQGDEIYPEGIVSGWFGTLTRAAVIRFQEKYTEDVLAPWNLTEGTGFAGITTRAKVNKLCILQQSQLPIGP